MSHGNNTSQFKNVVYQGKVDTIGKLTITMLHDWSYYAVQFNIFKTCIHTLVLIGTLIWEMGHFNLIIISYFDPLPLLKI